MSRYSTFAGRHSHSSAAGSVLIVQRVRSLKLKDRVYCLALAYDGEAEAQLPPSIGVGLAGEREEWAESQEPQAMWNPAEWQRYFDDRRLDLGSDVPLRTACEELDRRIARRGGRSVRNAVLWRTAAALRPILRSCLPVTRDFVVYAIDYELGTLRTALRRAAGPRQFAKWARSGWCG